MSLAQAYPILSQFFHSDPALKDFLYYLESKNLLNQFFLNQELQFVITGNAGLLRTKTKVLKFHFFCAKLPSPKRKIEVNFREQTLTVDFHQVSQFEKKMASSQLLNSHPLWLLCQSGCCYTKSPKILNKVEHFFLQSLIWLLWIEIAYLPEMFPIEKLVDRVWNIVGESLRRQYYRNKNLSAVLPDEELKAGLRQLIIDLINNEGELSPGIRPLWHLKAHLMRDQWIINASSPWDKEKTFFAAQTLKAKNFILQN